MKKDYTKTISELLKLLPEKQREIISRRFGLGNFQRETLESIGNKLGITRERVRQIEADAFLKLQPEIKKQKEVFKPIETYLNKAGGVKKEEKIFEDLATEKNHIFFLLSLIRDARRFGESEEFHPFWAVGKESFEYAKKEISQAFELIKKEGKPLKLQEISKAVSMNPKTLESFLEISKLILKNSEEFYGLRDWPEINPKRIKDKAYMVLKKNQKPLHFKEVAGLIPAALPQTVHNELIKDSRFVLVGRGIYALNEWGYERGFVKDVIRDVLKSGPLAKEEIIKQVQSRRIVKENTILLNLSNRKYFLRDPGGQYDIKTS